MNDQRWIEGNVLAAEPGRFLDLKTATVTSDNEWALSGGVARFKYLHLGEWKLKMFIN